MPARFASSIVPTLRSTVAALLVVSCSAGPAHSQTTSTWDGGIGNWTAVAHWNTPFFPNNGNGGVNWNAIVNGGTVTLDQNITVDGYTMGGGSLVAPGSGGPFTLTVNNSLSWTAGTIGAGQTVLSNGSATLDSAGLGGTFNNAGSATMGAVGGTAGAVFNNLAGATLTQSAFSLSGTGTLNNAGTYIVTGGHQLSWSFNNQAGGVVNMTNANLQLLAPGTEDGAFVLSNGGFQHEITSPTTYTASSSITGNGNMVSFGATIVINGTYNLTGNSLTWVTDQGSITFNSAYNSTGTLRIDTGGTINLNLPTTIPMLWLNGGTLGGAGAITLNGTAPNMIIEGGTFGGTSPTPIQNLGTMTIQQTNSKTFAHDFTNANGAVMNWTNGSMFINSGVTLLNQPMAAFNIMGDLSLGGTGTFSNAGTVTRSGGTGTASIGASFVNQPGALVDIQSGTLNLAYLGTIAGTFNVPSGTTLGFTGTQTFSGGAVFNGSGTLAFSGGSTTIATTLTFPNIMLNGGTLLGSGGLVTSNLTLGGVTLGRDLAVNGSSSNQFTGGILSINSGFTLTIPSGVILQAAAGSMFGAGTLNNQGAISKTGSGTLLIASAFTNSGSGVAVQGGTLQLSSPTPLTGSVSLANSTTLALGDGASLSATAIVSGAGQVQIPGINVTIAGSSNNTYGGGTQIASTGSVLVTGAGSAFGSANVTVAAGGTLRLSGLGNLTAGTTVVVSSGASLGLESSFDPASIIDPTSAGSVAINVNGFSTPLNQSTLGNGQMFLGAIGNDAYAATLSPGSGATYRLGGGGGTLTLNNTNALTGANAVIIGASNLSGTVVIAAANNYTGGTTLAAGTLGVGNNGGLGTGTLTLNGGTIQPSGGPITLANPISLGGNFTIAGSDNLTFTGDGPLTGNRTITVNGPGVATFSGTISETGAGRILNKAGAGTLILTGANTFSGGATVTTGTLQVTGANQSLGLGNAAVGPGAIIRLAAFTNLAGGATVNVLSGGVLGLDGNFPPTLAATSAGTVAINVANYSQTLNQATMGNGQMFIGSQGTGQYNAATLGAGASNSYRLGGAGGTLTVPNANVVTGFNGLIVGSTQTNGAGTVVLGASQDYQGNTTINSGSTLVTAGLTGPGTVSVLANGTLAGTGPIAGLVNVSGRVSPGTSSSSVLTANNGLTFASASQYSWKLSALTTGGSGTSWDRIDVGGGVLNVQSGAILAPQFIGTATAPNAGNPFWQANHTWNNVIGLTGTATSTGPLTFQINNSAWSGFGAFATGPATIGAGVELRWTPVPEPVHLLLLCGGTAVGVRWFRKQRRATNGIVA